MGDPWVFHGSFAKTVEGVGDPTYDTAEVVMRPHLERILATTCWFRRNDGLRDSWGTWKHSKIAAKLACAHGRCFRKESLCRKYGLIFDDAELALRPHSWDVFRAPHVGFGQMTACATGRGVGAQLNCFRACWGCYWENIYGVVPMYAYCLRRIFFDTAEVVRRLQFLPYLGSHR